MRKVTGWLALGGLAVAAVVFAQGSGVSVLQGFAKTVHGAESLNVVYTSQVVGGSSVEYRLALAKPNKARIEMPGKLVVADGSTITTFDKKAKTYFKEPQTKESFDKLFAGDDLMIWAAFFNAAALDNLKGAKLEGNRTISGVSYKVVKAPRDAQGRLVSTFFVDSSNLIRRAQHELNDQGVSETTLMNAKELTLGGATEANLFAFNAPEGAREITMEEMMSATWYHDLEEAKKVAAKTNRKIFVDFMATWCGPCKMLDREVLQTEGFKEYAKYFVFVKIDVDMQPNVAKAYSVTAMPTQMVLDKDGGVIGKTVGYGGPHPFYAFINQYK